jgi:uncharacterized protein
MSIKLTELWRYPVKSCRGERLREAVVEPWGLAGDRRWMIVDAAGVPVTAREYPPLVLVTPTLTSDGIRLASPGLPDLTVPVPAPTGSHGGCASATSSSGWRGRTTGASSPPSTRRPR